MEACLFWWDCILDLFRLFPKNSALFNWTNLEFGTPLKNKRTISLVAFCPDAACALSVWTVKEKLFATGLSLARVQMPSSVANFLVFFWNFLVKSLVVEIRAIKYRARFYKCWHPAQTKSYTTKTCAAKCDLQSWRHCLRVKWWNHIAWIRYKGSINKDLRATWSISLPTKGEVFLTQTGQKIQHPDPTTPNRFRCGKIPCKQSAKLFCFKANVKPL